MKRILSTLLGTMALATLPVLGQQPARPAAVAAANPVLQEQELTRFDLDFPGGTPRQLVEAIEKASGRPLNAIISDEDRSFHLPPLKMRGVNVAELFKALEYSNSTQIRYIAGKMPDGRQQYSFFNSSAGFRTEGTPRPDSVWYFFYNKPPVEEPKVCRFYQLAPYLDTYKVEDITTAIQTGWKMLGETNLPTISFHKDTKLLIAVGEASKLQLIDFVLQQLELGKGKPQSHPESAAKSSEAVKK